MGAYIFLCNDRTRAEVFERSLLGTRMSFARQMPVRMGDVCFVYDYSDQAHELHGPLIAATDAAEKIEPRAWSGQFPWQVRYDPVPGSRSLHLDEFRHLVRWGLQGNPEPRLTWGQANELRKMMVRGELPSPDLPDSDRGYLFLCNNDTAVECFDYMVFGANGEVGHLYRAMRRGDWLFLFNFQRRELYGPFRALSHLQYRESSGLFGDNFPCQVDVEYVGSDCSIPDQELAHLVDLRGRLPSRVLEAGQVKALLSRLRASQVRPVKGPPLPPGRYRARDGHLVRSRAELSIDDALDALRIRHYYEKSLFDPETGEEYLSDWYLPEPDIYIEYWELQDPDYLRRKEDKKRFYSRLKLGLVEMGPEDLEDVTRALQVKLRLPVG